MDTSHLKRLLQDKQDDRERAKLRDEREQARHKEILAAPYEVITSFWCKPCKRDFDASGVKTLNWGFDLDKGEAYIPQGLRQAWYSARCPSGHRAVRYITDKHLDPYYHDSEFVRRSQSEHLDDFLTPNDPGFAAKYPVQWAKLQKEKEQREIADEQRQRHEG